ncbi:MAG: bifunctional UDP-sugar hydrolase/5'-nucleotidase [Bacteroidales bacterium]|nr:bifunctional UDP-sugar hydrolase/5'-nucleotidase [Bacteroidales bacterium]
MNKISNLIYSVLLLLCITSCKRTLETPVITLVHTNDTHSQIDPLIQDGVAKGGLVERVAILEAMRDSFPNLIYLDGGDMVQGSPYFNLWKGKVEMEGMNLMKLTAATFGNHEFDNGLNYLDTMLTVAEFPILSCNYDCTGTPVEKHVKRTMIIENQGVRIGLTGITCNPYGLIADRNWNGIVYHDPLESANRAAAELKAQGCDIVILLSHEGMRRSEEEGDKLIAAQSSDIDIIIGGHTHTNIENGVEIKNREGRPVYITQTGGKANNMGRIDLQMKREGKRSDGSDKYVLNSIKISKIYADRLNLEGRGKKAEAIIKPYAEQISEKMQKILGYTDVELTRNYAETTLGNFTTDALRDMYEIYYGRKADMALMNVGGMRNDIAKGAITLGDIYKVYPFENEICFLEIKGKYIEQLLANRFLNFSGATAEVHSSKDGSKFSMTNIHIDGKPIEKEKTYIVATIDYLADGGDGMKTLGQADRRITPGVTIREAIIAYIQSLTASGQHINTQIDGRLRLATEQH